jgi:hypothetical protein
MTAEYIDLFESMNAELVKGTEEDLERFITSNPMQQLDTETNVRTLHSKRAVIQQLVLTQQTNST